MYTSYSFFIIVIIFFDLTIFVYFLSIYILQSFSILLKLYSFALLMVLSLLLASTLDLLFLLSVFESEK